MIAVALLVALLYADSLSAWYFLDDFDYFFLPDPLGVIGSEFMKANPFNAKFWRPIQSTLLATQQAGVGLAVWPCHLLQLGFHAALAIATWWLARYLGANSVGALATALFCTVSQSAAQAVVGVDTLSQVGATALLTLAVAALCQSIKLHGVADLYQSRHYWAAVGLFAAALLMKETAFCGFLLFAVVLVGVAPRGAGKHTALAWGIARRLLPFMVVFVLYALWRERIVESTPLSLGERYRFVLGLNTVGNTAMLFGSVISPISPQRLLGWWHAGQHVHLAAATMLTAILWGIVLTGLRRVRRPILISLLASAVAATLPMVLLHRVTEVYAYNLIPPIAVFFGLATGAIVRKAGPELAGRGGVAMLAITALIVVNAVSASDTTRQMVRNGQLSKQLYLDVAAALKRTPDNCTLTVVDPGGDDAWEYSVILRRPSTILRLVLETADRLERDRGVRVTLFMSPSGLTNTGCPVYHFRNGRLALSR